ncbi:MAG: MBL fold metallo-hydrolase [Mariprofundales bacterium]|nr:MBL fold metallo-hydrolase [Mariprofundales bacterium]
MEIKVIVHRGTDEIGGSCIEIKTPSERVLFDLGMPLMNSGGSVINPKLLNNPSITNGILIDILGLYDGISDIPIVGVLLSHAHPDHYGLLNYVHPSVPIYMSGESKALIEVGNIFYPENLKQTEIIKRCTLFSLNEPFFLGKFCITPYLIDHSAFGACSFLIEINGMKIVYTGDLRAHGRKGDTFRNLPKKVGHVDCMLMEGTTMGGNHFVGYDSEAAVEEGFIKNFSQCGCSFIVGSGSNVDRTVSLYRACKRAGKTLVIDLYQYYLLLKCKAFCKGLPPHHGDHLRVLFVHGQHHTLKELGMKRFLFEAKARSIFAGDIIAQPNKMVLRLSASMIKKIAAKIGKNHSHKFIYTMWKGYLKKDKDMMQIPEEYNENWIQVHTSGHAYLNDLKQLTQSIKPDKLIPIHTLQGDDFEHHFKNVVRIKNGEEFTLRELTISKKFKRGITNSVAVDKTKDFLSSIIGKELSQLIQERKVIACIRDNYIDFYASGCVILSFRPLGTKNKFTIHKNYLPDKYIDQLKVENPYISLTVEGDDLVLDHIKGFSYSQHILSIIRDQEHDHGELGSWNANLKAYITPKKPLSEKQGIHLYVKDSEQWKNKALLDLEATFSICEKGKKKTKRIY